MAVKTALLAGLLAALSSAASTAPAHADPVAGVLLSLAIILAAAQLGGDLAVRAGQPGVHRGARHHAVE
jgi:hypothetical protein